MNKLLLSGEDDLNNLVVDQDTQMILNLSDCNKDINIIVENNICLNVLEFSSNTNNKITFILKENSSLLCNRAIKNSNDVVITRLDGINSSVNINNSIICTSTSVSTFELRHNSRNTTSNLSNHGINFSNNDMCFKVDAYILRDSMDCITKQENKIINANCGKSYILPNLIVDNDEVEASHSAFIGDFDKESLFYMKSRGLSDEESRSLLRESFLLGNLDNIEDYIEQIKTILN